VSEGEKNEKGKEQMNLSEDYIIRLGKYLEYQKVEREAQRLEKAKEEVKRLAAETKRIKEQSKQVKERSKELKELEHHMKEYRYNIENPDPPEYFPDGRVLVTVWKALPKELEEEEESF
jgi:myosin heavy subunit